MLIHLSICIDCFLPSSMVSNTFFLKETSLYGRHPPKIASLPLHAPLLSQFILPQDENLEPLLYLPALLPGSQFKLQDFSYPHIPTFCLFFHSMDSSRNSHLSTLHRHHRLDTMSGNPVINCPQIHPDSGEGLLSAPTSPQWLKLKP